MKKPFFVLFLPMPLLAGPRASASYTIAAESSGAAGGRAISASYTNNGSAGGIAGTSTVAAPSEALRSGYIAQLWEATGLTLTAASAELNETGTLPLTAMLTLHDDTTLNATRDGVVWSVVDGPLAGISNGGLATAAAIYQDTAATAQGTHSGFTGTVTLNILNTLPDNFLTYAGDNIADDWQVRYFGLENPAAAPALDPDGDGFDNLFEYNARLVPTDALSCFDMSIGLDPNGNASVSFSPRIDDCSYTLMGSSDLSLWTPVAGAITDDGAVRTILDPAGPGPRRFYRINVQRK